MQTHDDPLISYKKRREPFYPPIKGRVFFICKSLVPLDHLPESGKYPPDYEFSHFIFFIAFPHNSGNSQYNPGSPPGLS